MKIKRRIEAVRFQTSQRGVKFDSLEEAKKDFLFWLDKGVSPRGAETRLHIWESGKERILTEIDHSERGENLRKFIRGLLQSGELRIHTSRKSRRVRRARKNST